MDVSASLTEIRRDGMQKWERDDLPKEDHLRYIWLHPFHSIAGAIVGSRGRLEFSKGVGGSVGGHWALWKVKELLP